MKSTFSPIPLPPPRAAARRQTERPIAGITGLFLATYPSGRRTYIFRYRDPLTGRKRSLTLGRAD